MPTELQQTPRGGLAHRVFDGLRPDDQVLAAFAFEPALTESQLAHAQHVLDAWSNLVPREDPDEPCHCDEPFLSPRTLRMRVHNLSESRSSVQKFIDELAIALPVREAHYSRWVGVPEREDPVAVLDPEAPEERTQFPTHDDYLRAVFDPESLPPASEYESQGKGAFETRTGDIVLEDRGVPLHLPPLRLAYGTAKGKFSEPDARANSIRDALRAELERSFSKLAATKVPGFFEHSGGLGKIDRLEAAGHKGYGFAIASPELVQRLSANRFRYREPEILEALIAVVASQKLAPIVTWQRFGKPFAKDWKSVEMHVFQIWEPG